MVASLFVHVAAEKNCKWPMHPDYDLRERVTQVEMHQSQLRVSALGSLFSRFTSATYRPRGCAAVSCSGRAGACG
jgi:hypothetical protein